MKVHSDNITKNAPFGYAYHKIILDKNGKPVDYEFLEINKIFEKLKGLEGLDVINKKSTELYSIESKEETDLLHTYGEVALKNVHKEFVQYSITLQKWYKVVVYSPGKYFFITIHTDITMEKEEAFDMEYLSEKNFDLLCVIDNKGNIIKANKEWEKTLGYTINKIKKNNFFDFIHPDDLNETIQVINKLSKQKKVISFYNRLKNKDGSYLNIKWEFYQSGDFIYAAAKDNTKLNEVKEKSEKKLEFENYLFSTLANNIPDRIYYKDRESKFIWTNASYVNAVRKMTGKTDIIGKTDFDLFTEEHAKPAYENEQKIIRTGKPIINIEEEETWIDGTVTWCLTNKMPLIDNKGEIIGTYGISRYITELKQAKEKLAEEHYILSMLMETIPDNIYIKDKKCRFIKINKAFRDKIKESGYKGEVIGKTDFDLFPYKHAIKAFNEEKTVMETGESLINIEEKVVWKDGIIRYGLTTRMPLRDGKGNIIGTFGVSKNINERKKMEEDLRKSEENLFITLNSIGDGVIATDINGLIERMNPIAEKLCGWTLEEAKGKHLKQVFRIVNAKTRKPVSNPVDKVLENGEIIGLANHTTLISKDGREYQVSDSAAPIKDPRGNIAGVVMVFSDITQDYNLRKKIKENEKRYRGLFNATIDGLSLNELVYKNNRPADYKIIDVNPQYEKITGIQKKEAIGNLATSLYKTNPLCYLELYAKTAITGESASFEDYFPEFNKYFSVTVSSPEKDKFAIFFQDINERKKAEEELEYERHLFGTLMDNVPVQVYFKDRESRFIRLNKAFEKIFDLNDINEAFRMTDFDFFTSEHANKTFKDEQKIIKTGKPINNIEEKETWPDGSVSWVSTSKMPLFDPKGNIIGTFGISHDITEMKKAEEALRKSEEKYRLFFEKSPLGIFHFDAKGAITDCNDPFVDIIGSSKKSLVGLNMTELPDKRIANSVKKVINGENASFEGDYSSATANKTTPVRVLFSPIIGKNNKVEGGMGIAEDRTDRIKKERLEKQVSVANESVKFKQNFLANMSHEIRTPLTGIIGLIEIIEKSNNTPELQDHIKILKSSSENLTEIIDQVLDFSKIEAGKIKLKTRKFEFDKLLNNAKVLFNSLCDNNQVSFYIRKNKNIPGFIKADEKRLTQIINNLLSNAIKFTKEGHIELNADMVEHSHESNKIIIKIEVKDTGIGIPTGLQKKLFAPFAQIDEHDTRLYEGTGLGLSICKELAYIHGGEIGVESKYNEGSTFWFTFAAEKAKPGKPIITENKKSSQKKLRILFAEDKFVNQKVVELMLNSMGHEVKLANNGQEAINIYKPGKFDIILMDIQMPVMDGITATKILKDKYKNLPPVVGLSANAFEGDREKYMSKGLDEYITKPVKEKDFDRILQKLGVG